MTEQDQKDFKAWKKKYFKEPKTEIIYRENRNNKIYTESQLIKFFKQAMCIK